MTAEADAGWERRHNGACICVPIAPADLDDVRAWCNENCVSDFLIVLDRRVLFQSREDAALATFWWRAEER